MAQKPPAFQFYAKDWESSATVRSMSYHDKGIYIDLLAAAWNGSEPGTIPLPLSLGAKVCRIHPTTLRRFLDQYPHLFVQQDGRLVNERLQAQWSHLQDVREQRVRAANIRYGHANGCTNGHANGQASTAVAVATATANTKDNPPLPPRKPSGGISIHPVFAGGKQYLVTTPSNVKRVVTRREMETMAGAHPSEWIHFFEARGWKAQLTSEVKPS
jgi:uncharacterized protein YdaU (DUF1376 family)